VGLGGGATQRPMLADRLAGWHSCRRCLVSGAETAAGIGEVMVMRVSVAGGTGVVGRPPRATQEGATG
jgi:hypothetical protein